MLEHFYPLTGAAKKVSRRSYKAAASREAGEARAARPGEAAARPSLEASRRSDADACDYPQIQ